MSKFQKPKMELSNYEGVNDRGDIIDLLLLDLAAYDHLIRKWEEQIYVTFMEKVLIGIYLIGLFDCFLGTYFSMGFAYSLLLKLGV